MKLINSSYKIIEQPAGITGMFEAIELAGRTCYKSEPKYGYTYMDEIAGITIETIIDPTVDDLPNAIKEYENGNIHYQRYSTTAADFTKRMINSGHNAMLEHGTVYLKLSISSDDIDRTTKINIIDRNYRNNPYTTVKCVIVSNYKSDYYITTNYRVLVENNTTDHLKYWCEPTEHHEKRITVKFICDRVTGESFLRHRVFSFARESTRYCNYSKDKFNNEITFIKPSWNYIKTANYNGIDEFDGDFFESSLINSERSYFKLINLGWKPQQARQVLPFAVCSPLVMTGFTSDWKHFFKLRCDKAAHPDARALAIPLEEEFKQKNII